jgi:hypothetical protein
LKVANLALCRTSNVVTTPDSIGMGDARPMPDFCLLHTGMNNLLKSHQQTRGAGSRQQGSPDGSTQRIGRILADGSY